MKFFKPHLHEYKSRETIVTVNYVTLGDVKEFHGEKFANQWYEFIKNFKKVDIAGKEAFYYADYKDMAIRTHMYLDVV